MHFNPDVAPVFSAVTIFFILSMGLLLTVLMALVYCVIFSKAGYCWVLGLIMFVPIANLIMLFVLAFGDWPVRRELRFLKQQLRKT